MAGEVQLTVQTNKRLFPTTSNQQLIYVLIEAQPTGAAAQVQMPLNFSLVLDHSGSMSGQKIESLREAAALAIDQMQANDVVSIVIFDDSVKLISASQPALHPDTLKREIAGIRAAGGTRMSKGMRLGLEELEKGRNNQRVSRMLLLTDGETFGDEETCRKLAREAGARVSPITALGLGEEWNEVLLDDIAEASGGTADFIPEEEPDVVLKTFAREVRTAQGTVVQDAQLLLRLVPGVTPRAVWRAAPLITKLGQRALSARDVQVALGDMNREQGQSILVELLVDPRKPGTYRLAQAEITYDVAALKLKRARVKTDILIDFTEDPAAVAERNPYVLNIVEKVTAHKLQTRALNEAALGNVSGATQKLRAAATRLLDMGEEDLAQTALEEAQRLEEGQELSSRGTKKLRYETRKLTQKLD